MRVTTVPPRDGPDHGATPRTTNATCATLTPLDVYSRPLVLSSTTACPDDVEDALHASAASLTYAAATTLALSCESGGQSCSVAPPLSASAATTALGR